MTYDPHTDTGIKRAIGRVRMAEDAYSFLGTVPVYSDDREEQERIDLYRNAVIAERQRAETCLLNLIGRRVREGGR